MIQQVIQQGVSQGQGEQRQLDVNAQEGVDAQEGQDHEQEQQD